MTMGIERPDPISSDFEILKAQNESLRDLVKEAVLAADGDIRSTANPISILAESGWFKRAKEEIGMVPAPPSDASGMYQCALDVLNTPAESFPMQGESERDRALEEAAQVVDQCNREGPYNAIGAASRLRALRSSHKVGEQS